MRLKTKGMLKRIGVLFMLLVLSITMMSGTQTAFAAEYTAYDNTDIESDLADIDTSAYPKDESARHRLLDDVGFMEYAYSDSVFIADNYYGLYFYVYNPTEKPVSLTSGAHHVNMATAYDENGEPSDYNNREITFLDATANNRFLKFKLTDSRAAYDAAVAYAAKHDGVRRYDIASIQLLFQGDDQATDSFTGVDNQEGISFTYYCTGYSAGCGADPEAESTLDIQYKKLDTIGLDIQSTWYRTDRIDGEMRYTLSSVYFAVDDKYITDYGALQIVKAEWYEYKTTPILVTDSDEVATALTPYLGYTLSKDEKGDYRDESVPFYFFEYLGPGDTADHHGMGWNAYQSRDELQLARYDWLIEVDDITATVPSAEVQDWAESYPIRAGDDVLTVGGRNYNANLFTDEADDGHTRGYNQRVFDARDEEQWIDLKTINQTSGWDRFWNQFLPAGSRDEDWVIEEDIKPIVEVTTEIVNAADAAVAQEVLIDQTQVSDLRNYVTKADEEGKTTYMLRFSLSEYNATNLEYHPSDDWSGYDYIDFYAATDTVYLSFDIIYLGFVKNDVVTIIPVVADPVDVYPSLDPTEDLEDKGGIPWWAYVILVVGELVVLLVLRLILCKLCNLPSWVMIILTVAVVVLDIFFIRTWAAWIASLLDPYLGWLPFS